MWSIQHLLGIAESIGEVEGFAIYSVLCFSFSKFHGLTAKRVSTGKDVLFQKIQNSRRKKIETYMSTLV